MKRMIFALVALQLSANFPPTEWVVEAGPVGVWRVVKTTPDGYSICPDCFYFDGKYLTKVYVPFHAMFWEASDYTYRMQTLWRENDLYFRWPNGGSPGKITFKDERFVERRGHVEVVYKKVPPCRLNEEEQLLIKERGPHDYRRTLLHLSKERDDGGWLLPNGP